MEPTDLFFIVLSAVIFGCVIAGVSVFAIIRYSRGEATGNSKFTDIMIALMAFAFVFYGMWRAGLFG